MIESVIEPSDSDLLLRMEILHPAVLDDLIILHSHKQAHDEDELLNSEINVDKQHSELLEDIPTSKDDEEKRAKKVVQIFEELLNYQYHLLETIRILLSIKNKAHSKEQMKNNIIISDAFKNIDYIYRLHITLEKDLESLKENNFSKFVLPTLSNGNKTAFLTLHQEFIGSFGHTYPSLAELHVKDVEFRALCLEQVEQVSRSRHILSKVDGIREILGGIPPLLKEGSVKKIPRRTTQKRILNRQMFLITEIDECENLGIPNCFRIRAKDSYIEITFSSEKDKSEWWNAIQLAIGKFNNESATADISEDFVDERAAEWVKDEQSTMCAYCCHKFTTVNRRHHCRACGQVFCGSCSAYRAPISFANGKVKRVCVVDYYIINSHLKPRDEDIYHAILQRKTASEPPVLSGYLYWSTYTESSWLSKPPFSTQRSCLAYRQLELLETDCQKETLEKRPAGKTKAQKGLLAKIVKRLQSGQSDKATSPNNVALISSSKVDQHLHSKDQDPGEEMEVKPSPTDSHPPSTSDSASPANTVTSVCTCQVFCLMRENSVLSVYVARADVKPWHELPLIGTRLVYLDKPARIMPRTVPGGDPVGESGNGDRITPAKGNPEVKEQVTDSVTAATDVPLTKEMSSVPKEKPSGQMEDQQPVAKSRLHGEVPPPLPRRPSRSMFLEAMSKLKYNLRCSSEEPNPAMPESEDTPAVSPEKPSLVRYGSHPDIHPGSYEDTAPRPRVTSVLQDFRDRIQTSSSLRRNLEPLGPVEALQADWLGMLTNRQSFLILPLNNAFAHFFEAPTPEIRDRWINAIRQTCITMLQK